MAKNITLKAYNIVIFVGMKPKIDKALEFAQLGIRFFGDCNIKLVAYRKQYVMHLLPQLLFNS